MRLVVSQSTSGGGGNKPHEHISCNMVVFHIGVGSLQSRLSELVTILPIHGMFANKPQIKDLRDCNKTLELALEGSGRGIYFASEGVTRDDMVICTVSDASFCNETAVVGGEKEGNRSQQGYFIALAPADMMNRSEATIHPIAWSSTIIKRVCRSTLMAETFAMIRGTEAGCRLRAAT